MRIRPLLTAAALAAGLIAAPGISTAAAADTAMAAGHTHAVGAAACTYRRVGNSWRCITPGAYCPKAAHLKIGTDKYNGRRYRCVRYANGQWRWKRA